MPPHAETRGERSGSSSSLAYVPALDGIRGACLLAVMLYHSSFAWLPGAFFSVSTFFTLSGFLITTLLLAEQQRTGALSLRRFWGHRLRRLLPAALLTVATLVATAPLWLVAAQREHVAEDALASLLYVVNWRFMSPQYAYDLTFVDPSPFQHFWTLAIEGQFYLIFPVLVGLTLRLGGAPLLGVACLLLTLGSIAAGWAIPADDVQHRAYYGTDVRMGELVIGALLATVLYAYPALTRGAARRALRVLGGVALVAILVAWTWARVGDVWVYRGGFAAYSVLSALLIAASTLDGGPAIAVLSVGWLRWIGTVSYGAYLFHWPLFMLLTTARTGLGPVPLFALRVAATLALAGLSYRFVERPVRRGDLLPGSRFAWTTGVALLVVGTLAIASNPIAILVLGFDTMHRVQLRLRGEQAPVATGISFAMFGDSTAASLWSGLGPWLRDEGGSSIVEGYSQLGCGVFAFGQLEKLGEWSTESDKCAHMSERWRDAALAHHPKVAVVLIGPWEARNRRRSENSPTLKLGDPELDDATRAAIAEAADGLIASGASVIWLTAPHVEVPSVDGQRFDSDRDASETARMDRLNVLIAEVAAARTGRMRVVDLGAYLRRRPGGELDPAIRGDGVHYTAAGSHEIAHDWLGAEILRAAEDLRPRKSAL